MCIHRYICRFYFLFYLFVSVHYFFNDTKSLVMIKQQHNNKNKQKTEWSTIPACPSLSTFFVVVGSKGDVEGTSSSIICIRCFTCFVFVFGFICGGDLTCVLTGDRGCSS